MAEKLKNYNIYFFFLALIAISIATFFILKPFLSAILIAGVLAILFQRPYNFFLKITKNRRAWSSLFTSILVVFMVVVPLFVAIGLITNEVNIFYREFLADGSFFHKYLERFVSNLEKISILGIFDLESAFSGKELSGSFKNLGSGILTLVENAYQGMAGFILWIFAMFFSLYYFLIDGERVIKRLLYLSPLKDEHEKIIIQRFNSIVRAVTKGVIIIGLVQSTIGGLAFAIAGVPSPVIWGIVMFFFSLIPMVGTSLIWFPTGLILLLGGGTWEGVFILSVGLFIISTIDNVLRPKLVGRDTQIHPLLIFFATLGGFMVFGPTGFILGPVIVAMALSLWNIYASEFKDDLKNFNA